MKFTKGYWFGISVFFILILTIFLRFYNYSNRWALWVDQASFALLSRYALEAHKIPLLGPFSSAGPFQTGGEWYWFIMAAISIFPNSAITPWIGLTVVHVFFVLFIILVGKKLSGIQFGLITGLLAASSTAQIVQSSNLTNQSPLAIISLFVIWMMIKYVQTKKIIHLFFLSLFVGVASTIHLQGMTLIVVIPITILFTRRFSVPRIILSLIGFFLPWLPVFVADFNNHFLNTQNMFRYYFQDQYLISLDVLGRRWLTYAGIFWPNSWAHIIGGQAVIGYLIILLLTIFIFLNSVKKSISKEWYIIIISFFAVFTIMRYVRTPLYDSYLVVTHPFVILLTGWVILSIWKLNRILGTFLIAIIVVGSLNKDIKEIVSATNDTARLSEKIRTVVINRYPNTKFEIYDYRFKSPGISQPLTLFLDEKNKIDDNGKEIGVSATSSAKFQFPVIYEEKEKFYVLDISASTEAQLLKYGWESVNPGSIYKNVQEWYKYKK